MKITCKQQDLAKGLSTVSHAVSSRSTLPILANILLTTDAGRLKLSATNLEIGINCWIDAEIIEEGSTTTPTKTISDLVNSLRAESLDISVDDETHVMTVKGKGSHATVKGLNPDEFPLVPGTDGGETYVTFGAAQLKQAISMVAMAAADDDARPVLTGTLFEMKDGRLTLAAADAFRLATLECDEASAVVSEKLVLTEPLLIPAKTLNELARILPNEGTVQMIVTPNRSQVLFHTENVDMVSRLIEGTFPNFRGIMPNEYKTRCVVETKEFAAAVKTVTPFAKDSSNIARIKLTPSEHEYSGIPSTLTIEATAEDVGSNVSTINASIEGPEQEIIFNVKYLSDVLSVIGTEKVALEIVSKSRPGVIRPVNGGDYTYIIMPMSAAK